MLRLSKWILVAAAFICFLAGCYVFYNYYISTLNAGYGIGLRRTALGSVIAFGATGILLASLRLPPVVRINMALCLVVVGLGGYAAEAWLAFSYISPAKRAAEIAGRPYDDRTNIEIRTDLRRQRKNVQPAIFPSLLLRTDLAGELHSVVKADGKEIFPLGGISHATTIFCNESGEYSIYLSDRYGFNNPDTVWDSERLDILVLGNGIAQGACVSAEATIAARLREGGLAVASLGISNNGPLIELASLIEYGSLKKPRVVLWHYYEGKALKPQESRWSAPVLRQYVEGKATQDLPFRQAEIDAELGRLVDREMARARQRWVIDVAQFATLFRIRKLFEKRVSDVSVTEDHIVLIRQVVNRANETVKSWGGTLYFVYLPSYSRYLMTGGSPDWQVPRGQLASLAMRDRILTTVTEIGLNVIDIHCAFLRGGSRSPTEYFVYPGSHFNEEGYRFIADSIRKQLERVNPRNSGGSRPPECPSTPTSW